MINFQDISYLQKGNALQQQVYDLLTASQILTDLKAYNPIVVGSIPINVQVAGSDIDIICCYADKREFEATITTLYSQADSFTIGEMAEYGTKAIVANFDMGDFPIEIFGQELPTQQQPGYRHLVIEHQLLLQYGDPLRTFVVDQKLKGEKTEPAFCAWLGIKGDPYLELLKLEKDQNT